jgi:hypothetical protein
MTEKGAGRRHPMLDLRVPFFDPVWRRVATVLVLAGWLVVELTSGNPYWAMLVGGIGAYCIYVFFFDFQLPEGDGDD